MKFDKTLDNFAADVADRANKIRAEEAKVGNDMDPGEARQQAIAELKPFVKPTESGGVTIPVIGTKIGTETKYTYTRGASATTKAPDASPEVVAFMDKMAKGGQSVSHTGAALTLPDKPDPSKMKKGSVYQTPRGLALWDGSKFVQ